MNRLAKVLIFAIMFTAMLAALVQVTGAAGASASTSNTAPIAAPTNYTLLANSVAYNSYALAKLGAVGPCAVGCGSFYQANVLLPYGVLMKNSSYVQVSATATHNLYYFKKVLDTYNSVTQNVITIYNFSLKPASPTLCITMLGSSYCGNQSVAIPVDLPLINGTLGFTGQKIYSLSVTFSGSALNNLNWNYSVVYKNNHTALTPVTSVLSTQNFSVTKTYSIPVTSQVEAIAGASGNANYSKTIDDPFTSPANIIAWVNVTPSSACNTFQCQIPINLVTYNNYVDGSANNIEFFYPNGTLAKSWLEGNVLNEQQSTSMNTISNALYWVKLNPAASGTTNVIAFGFAKMGTNLFTGQATGEAPQLSPTYGLYDNGNLVFNTLYDNFSYQFSGYWTGSTAGTTNNGLIMTSGNLYTGDIYHMENNLAIDFYGYGGRVNWYNRATNHYDAAEWADQCAGTKYGLISFDGSIGAACSTISVSSTYRLFYNLSGNSADAFLQIYDPSGTQSLINNNDYPFDSVDEVLLYTSGGTNLHVTWIRVRLSTASMPSMSFSGPQLPPQGSLTINENPMLLHQVNFISFNSLSQSDTTNIIVDNVQVASGTGNIIYNANTLTAGAHSVLGCDVTTSTCSSPQTLNVNFYIFKSGTTPSPAYETQTKTYTFNINMTAASNTATGTLQMNGQNVQSQQLTPTTGAQAFTYTFTVPLLPSNNLVYQFNGLLSLTFPNSTTINFGVFNSLYQTELEGYLPSVNPQYSNTILGENQTVNVILTDLTGLGLANYAGSLNIGNVNNIAEFVTSPYHFYSSLNSFVPINYGITNPSHGNSITINVNAIVQLSYNGNSTFRNTTGSFVSTYQWLSACGAPYSTSSLQWVFFTLPNSAIFTSNVFLSGYYQIIKNSFSFNAVGGSASGFPPVGTATANTYSTCIFPSWAGGPASFSVSGFYQYNASTYAQAGFYLVNQRISNSLQYINLYLSNTLNPELYSIAVQNATTGAYIASTVQILQFQPDTNSSILVNEIQTPSGGTTQTYLTVGQKYQFAVYSAGGQLLKLTGYITTESCGAPPCLLVIFLGSTNINPIQSYSANMKYQCSQALNLPANTGTVTCTYSSINGTAQSVLLQLQKTFLGIPTCAQTQSGVSGSVSCTGNAININSWTWSFSQKINGQYVTLTQGSFGTQGAIFGQLGEFFALVIILAMGGLFALRNHVAALVISDAMFIVFAVINILPVPIPVLGASVLVIAMLVWVSTRT